MANPPSYVYDLLESESQVRWGANQALGSPVTIKFSFPTSQPADIPGNPPISGYGVFNDAEIAATRSALTMISSFTKIQFQEVAASDASADLRFGNADLTAMGTIPGIAFYSFGSPSGLTAADVVLNTAGPNSVVNSGFVPGSISSADIAGQGWSTLLHEIGHALGLKHPFETNIDGDPNSILPTADDFPINTQMSYAQNQPGSNVGVIEGSSVKFSTLKPTTFSIYDIAALQYLYGQNTTSGGNQTYTFQPNSPVYMTLSDNGPNNTVNLSALTGPNTVDMQAGGRSNLAISQELPGFNLPNKYDGNGALTVGYNATLANVIGGSGVDNVTGNSSNNQFTGNAGNDIFNGGHGTDTAIYNVAQSAATITTLANGSVRVTAGANGTDTLTNVEFVRFTDATVRVAADTVPQGDHFNGDGNADVLWRHNTGLMSMWNMNADGTFTPVNVVAPGTDWKIAETGDFNNDGSTDIVWRHDSGSMSFWYMNTDGTYTTANPAAPTADWTVQGTGDYNADGNADILWRNETGFMSMWQMTGPDTFNPITVAAPSEIQWKIQSTGDFNADGRSDVLWRHDDGYMSIWHMNADGSYTTANPAAPGSDWQIKETGDFNGDGVSDILWRHDSGSFMSIWHMNTDGTYSSVVPAAPGSDWAVQKTGDYNGDGRSDILWRHESGAFMSIWHMNADGSFSNVVPAAPGTDWMVQ